MKREQIAINSVSTRHADLEGCLDAYARAGFAHVEFALFHVKEYLAKGRGVGDVARLLRDHDLACIGGFETPLLCFAPEERRRQNHETVMANARLLAELGAGILVVGTDGPDNLKTTPDPLGQMAEIFAQVAEEIADTGVTLCIEFNWSPVVKSLRTAVEIAQRSDRSNVGVLFDPAHYHCTPSKLEQIHAGSAPFIRHVHVDDMRDKPGELSDCNGDRVLPGEGCLDLAGILGAIEGHCYDGYFSIELFNQELWEMPAVDAAQRMYESMVRLVKGGVK